MSHYLHFIHDSGTASVAEWSELYDFLGQMEARIILEPSVQTTASDHAVARRIVGVIASDQPLGSIRNLFSIKIPPGSICSLVEITPKKASIMPDRTAAVSVVTDWLADPEVQPTRWFTAARNLSA